LIADWILGREGGIGEGRSEFAILVKYSLSFSKPTTTGSIVVLLMVSVEEGGRRAMHVSIG